MDKADIQILVSFIHGIIFGILLVFLGFAIKSLIELYGSEKTLKKNIEKCCVNCKHYKIYVDLDSCGHIVCELRLKQNTNEKCPYESKCGFECCENFESKSE